MTQTNEQAMTAMLDRIADLEREVRRLTEKYEGLSPEEMYRRTSVYIAMNPEVWQRLKEDAAYAVAKEQPFSIAKEFEELRASRWLQRNEHEEYKCNNSYRAVLTRFLVADIPSLKPYVTLRRSKVDKFFKQLWKEGGDAA